MNPTDTVTISNKKTGVIRRIPRMELPKYGLPMDYVSKIDSSTEAVKSGQLTLQDLPQEQRSVVATSLPPDFEQQTKIQKDKTNMLNEVKNNAQAVLDVMDQGKQGKLKGQAYKDALQFAASRYAASAGFGEGGKVLSGAELGILSGAMPRIEPQRKQNLIERITGQVPPATGRIIDSEQQLRNKALIATGKQPESYSGVQNSVSGGGFAENVGQDIQQNVQGLLAIPGVLGGILTGKIPAGQALGAVGKGLVNEYKGLVVNPETNKLDIAQPAKAFYQRPISTILDVLPFLQAGKAAMMGRIGKTAETAKALETAGVIGKEADIANILKKAETVGQTGEDVSQLSKNLYQSVLNIPKKGNAFEKLKPASTAGEMIKYGIAGSPDQILQKVNKVTGEKGVLSGIVNDLVGSTKAEADLSPAIDVLKKSEDGRFSALGNDKINQLINRVSSLKPGKKLGEVNISDMLDFERKIQTEAVQHYLAGSKGDTAAAELSKLKFDLADEMGIAIDKAIKSSGVGIEQYKTPQVQAYLNNISPKLANEFMSADSLSKVRSLQKPFVRMSKILELSANEPASTGQKLLGRGILGRIPVLGPTVETAAESASVPFSTKSAVALNNPLIKKLLNVSKKTVKKTALSPLPNVTYQTQQ